MSRDAELGTHIQILSREEKSTLDTYVFKLQQSMRLFKKCDYSILCNMYITNLLCHQKISYIELKKDEQNSVQYMWPVSVTKIKDIQPINFDI